MTKSPRPQSAPGRTTKSHSSEPSTPQLLFMTALDTTWRVFVPPLVATFVGIGLDHLFDIAPTATIACIIIGAIVTGYLVARQLKKVKGSL